MLSITSYSSQLISTPTSSESFGDCSEPTLFSSSSVPGVFGEELSFPRKTNCNYNQGSNKDLLVAYSPSSKLLHYHSEYLKIRLIVHRHPDLTIIPLTQSHSLALHSLEILHGCDHAKGSVCLLSSEKD